MQMNNVELLRLLRLLFLIWLEKKHFWDALQEILFLNKTGPLTRTYTKGKGWGSWMKTGSQTANLISENLSVIENIVRKLHKIVLERSDHFCNIKVKAFSCDGSLVFRYLSLEWLCLRFFCNGNSGMTRRTRFSLALSLLQICLGTLRAVKRLTTILASFWL